MRKILFVNFLIIIFVVMTIFMERNVGFTKKSSTVIVEIAEKINYNNTYYVKVEKASTSFTSEDIIFIDNKTIWNLLEVGNEYLLEYSWQECILNSSTKKAVKLEQISLIHS